MFTDKSSCCVWVRSHHLVSFLTQRLEHYKVMGDSDRVAKLTEKAKSIEMGCFINN
jgi:hypothetical protein